MTLTFKNSSLCKNYNKNMVFQQQDEKFGKCPKWQFKMNADVQI